MKRHVIEGEHTDIKDVNGRSPRPKHLNITLARCPGQAHLIKIPRVDQILASINWFDQIIKVFDILAQAILFNQNPFP